MATRFDNPIQSQVQKMYVSQSVPLPLDAIYKNLQNRQLQYDEVAEQSANYNNLINTLPTTPFDAPVQQKIVAESLKGLDDFLKTNPDLGTPMAKRKLGELYNSITNNKTVKTLVNNYSKYQEMLEKKEQLEEEGRFFPELLQHNGATLTDAQGNLRSFDYNLERGFTDEEYFDPITKFANMLKADGISKEDIFINDDGTMGVRNAKSKGISQAKINNFSKMMTETVLNSDVGKQRFRRYAFQTQDPKKALMKVFGDVKNIMSLNQFSETEEGYSNVDFGLYKEKLLKEEEKQEMFGNPLPVIGDYGNSQILNSFMNTGEGSGNEVLTDELFNTVDNATVPTPPGKVIMYQGMPMHMTMPKPDKAVREEALKKMKSTPAYKSYEIFKAQGLIDKNMDFKTFYKNKEQYVDTVLPKLIPISSSQVNKLNDVLLKSGNEYVNKVFTVYDEQGKLIPEGIPSLSGEGAEKPTVSFLGMLNSNSTKAGGYSISVNGKLYTLENKNIYSPNAQQVALIQKAKTSGEKELTVPILNNFVVPDPINPNTPTLLDPNNSKLKIKNNYITKTDEKGKNKLAVESVLVIEEYEGLTKPISQYSDAELNDLVNKKKIKVLKQTLNSPETINFTDNLLKDDFLSGLHNYSPK